MNENYIVIHDELLSFMSQEKKDFTLRVCEPDFHKLTNISGVYKTNPANKHNILLSWPLKNIVFKTSSVGPTKNEHF